MTDLQTSQQSFFPKHVSWLTILLAILAVGTFIAISGPSQNYPIPMGGGVMESGGTRAVPPSASPGMPAVDTSVSGSAYYPSPYPYSNPDVPVTDTREFLKTYYTASMYTRNVQDMTRRVETTVRGYDGRIDQESSSPKYGYVSFAVPQAKYDAFRTELESLVDSRFLTVNISSQNLLPEKVSIEEQQKQADSTLSGYQTSRTKLVSAHASAAQSLQSKIDADTAELVSLRAQSQTPQIEAQIQSVSSDLSLRQKQLADENASYAAQLKNIDANISYAEDWQKAVQTHDQAFLDNVATVTGTVSIQWISLWDIAQLYLPGYWIPAIFAALSFLSLLADRRRYRLHHPA